MLFIVYCELYYLKYSQKYTNHGMFQNKIFIVYSAIYYYKWKKILEYHKRFEKIPIY
jgi:hypothetical protein